MNKNLEKIVIGAGITVTAVVALAATYAIARVWYDAKQEQKAPAVNATEYQYDPMNRQR